MNTQDVLNARSGAKCELCAAVDTLAVYEVPPTADGGPETSVLTCATCREKIEIPQNAEDDHWRCLSDSMWSPVPAVQVMAWRMLNRVRSQSWAQDLLDILYLDDETQAWALSGDVVQEGNAALVHHDSNGTQLAAGDTVTLIKDLNVKGAGFTAKRGTAVRGISLVPENSGQIEGRVNGQQIVILTEFVRKSG